MYHVSGMVLSPLEGSPLLILLVTPWADVSITPRDRWGKGDKGYRACPGQAVSKEGVGFRVMQTGFKVASSRGDHMFHFAHPMPVSLDSPGSHLLSWHDYLQCPFHLKKYPGLDVHSVLALHHYLKSGVNNIQLFLEHLTLSAPIPSTHYRFLQPTCSDTQGHQPYWEA